MIRDAPDGALITIRVIPRAGRTTVAGARGDALLVRLTAAPLEGAANAALVALLADTLQVPRRDVRLTAGERSRSKTVLVRGVTANTIRQRLAAAGAVPPTSTDKPQ